MRIFQNAGLSSEIKKIARASHKGMHFLGPDNKTLMVRKGFKGIGDQGWENNWYFFQPDLEKTLRKGLQRFSNVTIRLGEEVTDIANNKLSSSSNLKKFRMLLKYNMFKKTTKKALRSLLSNKFNSVNKNPKFPDLDQHDIDERIKKFQNILGLSKKLECKFLSKKTIHIKCL